ncbi:basic helix-loop-helix protein [Ophidiomyces ophidiicola]|nr:basic helix-loop-helix protein [Ophidiomyces ophidiicola]KAI2001119.1 basic helix-loop-helix protein [Ophidiomyces ophidiicola]KAI2010404.1 basic helix-loop-helix protein [Ophidiomyces ophidiicola]KAI2134294.1 basic helix-loop-helix protein [Ophidiomyces ophidiicola]KAI2136696.1 basic helix-loop-helix protein [Ophidiomyces ophidiicola]
MDDFLSGNLHHSFLFPRAARQFANPAMSEMGMSANDSKRKRESLDAGDNQRLARSPQMVNTNGMHAVAGNNIHGYDTHGLNNATELSHIDQQLLQHVGGQNGVSDDNAMTAKAALAHPQSKYSAPDSAFDSSALSHGMGTFGDDVNQVAMPGVHGHNSTAAAVYAAREAQSIGHAKPPVGSPEWHTQRKNNHKEVERRRRETINEGINELAKLVPGCEKAKGSILQRAVQYISKLQEENKNMVDRWDTTQMTTTQAITEISSQNNKAKAEVNRRGIIAMKWLQRCREAGLDFPDYDDDKDLAQFEVDDVQL